MKHEEIEVASTHITRQCCSACTQGQQCIFVEGGGELIPPICSPLCTISVVAPTHGFMTSLYTSTSAAKICPNVPMLRNQPRLLRDLTCTRHNHFISFTPGHATQQWEVCC